MTVVFTEKAEYENKKNIDYLYANWNQKVVESYILDLKRFVELVKINPKMGRYESRFGVYRFVVVPQISIFYDILEKEEIILIKSFWNNYQYPYWEDF